jgi:alpha-beta hydrolase superfamily lysophospholipase
MPERRGFDHYNPFEYKVKDEKYDGLRLGVYHTSSDKNPKALVLFLPDFGISSNVYGHFFSQFGREADFRTFAFDRRGSGRSQGTRGEMLTN